MLIRFIGNRPRRRSVLPRPRRLRGVFVAVLALVALLASACGGKAGGESAAPPDSAPQVTVPTSIPPGVTLRLGDQLDYFKNVLALSGQDKDLPYTIDYANFLGGPAMLQAFQAGEIDLGFVANTPLIFAQAAGQRIYGVAGWALGRSPYSLVAAPGVDGIKGWGDLKGKKVAFQQGTALEGAVLTGLASAGLRYQDIEPVLLPVTQGTQALEGGSVDAAILTEPFTTAYLTKNPNARKVLDTEALTDKTQFVIADQKVLGDEGKTAATADFVRRLVKAFQWVNAHPEAWAQKLYVEQYGIPLEKGVEILKSGGGVRFLELPGELTGPTQKLADLYVDAGELPTKVDVSNEFDPRFNTVVQEASRS